VFANHILAGRIFTRLVPRSHGRHGQDKTVLKRRRVALFKLIASRKQTELPR